MKIEKEATGGKRAWKSPGTGVDEGLDSRAQSLEIFRKHKREELRQEIVLIDEFMERMILLQSPQPIVLKSDAVTVIKKGKGHDVQEEKGDGKGKMKSQGQSEVKGEDTGGKEGSDKSKAGGEKNISKNNKDNKNAVDANVVKEITSSSSSSSSSVEGVNSTEAKNQNQNQGDSSNKKKKKKRKGGAGTDTNEVIVEVSNDNKLLYLLPFYSRLFSFSMPQNHQNEAIIVNTDVTVTTGKSQILPPSLNPKEIVLEELCQAVNSKFGLSVCLQKLNLGASAVSASSTCDENNFNGSSSKRMKSEENVLDNEESSSTEKVTETSNSKALEIDEEDKVNVGEENGKKTLSRKEKRNESNINKKNKNKKKKAATTTIEKKIEKIETLNEILFKNIMSENILSNGFINFNSVFEKKIFIKEIKNEIQNENTNISHINNSTEDKKVDEISQIEINKSTIVPITVPILKLEICSGAGEWAISQATNDKSSNWVTMELRHDRVYQTFTRSIYAGKYGRLMFHSNLFFFLFYFIFHHYILFCISTLCFSVDVDGQLLSYILTSFNLFYSILFHCIVFFLYLSSFCFFLPLHCIFL